MRVIVQLTDLSEPLRAGITSHINAKWPGVTIDGGNVQTQRNGAQASLIIRAKREASVRTTAQLGDTISVEGKSLEEVLFLVDAKLGKLTKSHILTAKKESSVNPPISRRDFLSGAFRKSPQPNDAPVVLPDSCEARFGCRKCVDACPAPGALVIESKTVVVSSDHCIRCALCAGVCPVAAIQIPSITEEAYRGLLSAVQDSPAPKKTLLITCDEQSVPQLPWMDVEQVPGVGVMGVRQVAMAASSSVSEVIIYCPDGLCAGKDNAKRAASLISSLANEGNPVVSYVEGRAGAAQIERIHNQARKRERTLTFTEPPWRNYVDSIRSLSPKDAQVSGLCFTDIQVANSCTLCNACAESCPHQALAIQEGELLFHEEKCTGCGYCEQICPERSITLSEKVGMTTIATRTVYKDEMITCTNCKAPFVSVKMLKKISQTLQTDNRTMRLCPKCRQAEIYQNVFGNTRTNSDNR